MTTDKHDICMSCEVEPAQTDSDICKDCFKKCTGSIKEVMEPISETVMESDAMNILIGKPEFSITFYFGEKGFIANTTSSKDGDHKDKADTIAAVMGQSLFKLIVKDVVEKDAKSYGLGRDWMN